MAVSIARRQTGCWDDYYCVDDGHWVVRYVVVAAVVVAVLLYIFLGMWHANRRIRQGKQPLWYHKWLVPSRTRDRLNGQNNPNIYGPAYYPSNGAGGDQQYRMNDMYRPPPPVYSPNDGPPKYEAPEGPPPGHAAKGGAAVTTTPVGESSNAGASTEQAAGVQQPAPAFQASGRFA